MHMVLDGFETWLVNARKFRDACGYVSECAQSYALQTTLDKIIRMGAKVSE